MKPRFIGHINWARQQHGTPDLWRLEEPYAQVTSDGYLIMCPLWHGINGASIPRVLWPIPGLGHPFEGHNKDWSPPHDMGYDGSAIVIDLKTPQAQVPTPEAWAALWAHIPEEMRIDPRSLGRRWWDKAMLEGMQICGERPAKQFIIYRGVRLGGGRAWRRAA
jgi:hypothetical protein